MGVSIAATGRIFLSAGFPNIKPVSVTARVRCADFTALQGAAFLGLSASDDNWRLVITTTGQLSAYISPSSFTSAAGLITAGCWNHIAFTYGDEVATNTVRVYLNGVMVASGTVTPPAIASSRCGTGDNATTQEAIHGGQSDLIVWNRELSASEIALAAETVALPSGMYGGLYGYYRFDSSAIAGINVADWSGNGNKLNGFNGAATLYEDPPEPLSARRWFAPLSTFFPATLPAVTLALSGLAGSGSSGSAANSRSVLVF